MIKQEILASAVVDSITQCKIKGIKVREELAFQICIAGIITIKDEEISSCTKLAYRLQDEKYQFKSDLYLVFSQHLFLAYEKSLFKDTAELVIEKH